MKPSGKDKNKLRLQVFLSHSGACSRRKAMDLIFEGRVSVNGKIIREPSTPVDVQRDVVCLDRKKVSASVKAYIIINKPKGYVTTKSDPYAQKIVTDLLPAHLKHLYPVGRLDKDTHGLLVLTNDGDVAYALSHPKFDIKKGYVITINGLLSVQTKERLEKGIVIDGKKTAPASVHAVKKTNRITTFILIIHEGRKRQIRRMLAVCGHKVTNLKRISQGPLSLGSLKEGAWRVLTSEEISALKKLVHKKI